MRYAYVQIRKPINPEHPELTQSCFEILEYFDDVKEIIEIHKGAPHQDWYTVIQVFV